MKANTVAMSIVAAGLALSATACSGGGSGAEPAAVNADPVRHLSAKARSAPALPPPSDGRVGVFIVKFPDQNHARPPPPKKHSPDLGGLGQHGRAAV